MSTYRARNAALRNRGDRKTRDVEVRVTDYGINRTRERGDVADGFGGATGERERRGTTTDTDYAFPTNLVETPNWCDNF